MPGNRGDLHWVQSLLEEPAGGFVPEIVKMKILDPGLLARIGENMGKPIGRETPYRSIKPPGKIGEDLDGIPGQGNSSWCAVLRLWDPENSFFEVQMFPPHGGNLSPSHAGFYSKPDQISKLSRSGDRGDLLHFSGRNPSIPA